MKTLNLVLIVLAVVVAGCQAPVSNRASATTVTLPVMSTPAGSYVADEILILAPADTDPAAVDAQIPGTRVKTVATFAGKTVYQYRLSGTTPLAVQKLLETSGSGLLAALNGTSQATTVPTDPAYADYQYSAQLTDLESVWGTSGAEGTGLTVAVIDTGVNGAHEELSGRVLAGWNTLDYDGLVPAGAMAAGVNSDNLGHGSHVAGIIAAAGNNGTGIAGVAWGVSILPVKLFGVDSSGNKIGGEDAQLIAALLWAVDNGADVINLSLGSPLFNPLIADAINYALTQGVVVVASMGNDGRAVVNFPAAYSGVIAVGSTGSADTLSGFSSLGPHISVSAPGESIYSLGYSSSSSYVFNSGTSMSAPFVSGLAAVLLSKAGGAGTLTPDQVRTVLETTAEDKGTSGFDSSYGWGRVNAEAAVTAGLVATNYGTVTVNVTSGGWAEDLYPVYLLDSTGTTIVSAAFTASENTASGSVLGQARFPMVSPGTYTVLVSSPNSSSRQSAEVTVTASNAAVVQAAF